MSQCQLLCVAPAQVADFWPHVKDMLLRACERGLHDYGAMRKSLETGTSLLWLAHDDGQIYAAATTELHKINGHLRCFIAALGGQEHARWLHLIAGIEQFARNEGAESVILMGRQGWQRLLAEYRTRGVILERTLT